MEGNIGFMLGCACHVLEAGGLCGGGASIGANPVLFVDMDGPAGGELKKLVACSLEAFVAG